MRGTPRNLALLRDSHISRFLLASPHEHQQISPAGYLCAFANWWHVPLAQRPSRSVRDQCPATLRPMPAAPFGPLFDESGSHFLPGLYGRFHPRHPGVGSGHPHDVAQSSRSGDEQRVRQTLPSIHRAPSGGSRRERATRTTASPPARAVLSADSGLSIPVAAAVFIEYQFRPQGKHISRTALREFKTAGGATAAHWVQTPKPAVRISLQFGCLPSPVAFVSFHAAPMSQSRAARRSVKRPPLDYWQSINCPVPCAP